MFITNRDASYIKKQDALAYKAMYPYLPVRFVNRRETASYVDNFNNQNLIKLYPAVQMPIYMKFDDMNRVMNRLNLQELPEATAVFSVGILEEFKLPSERITVEPDVIITFQNFEYRITKHFPQDFVGHLPNVFLHIECTLERNSRSEHLMNDNMLTSIFYYGTYFADATMDDIRKLTVSRSMNNEFLFNAYSGKMYFSFPSVNGRLVSIRDVNGMELINDFTVREVSDSSSKLLYLIYESRSLVTGTFKLRFYH